MKILEEVYRSLVDNHEQMLKEAEENTLAIQYARNDFFSLEPMYHQVNNVSTENLNFYNSVEELPSGSEIHICVLGKSKLLQSRNSYGEGVYYDSFYTYADNEKWRLELYVNPEIQKPIKVERLITTEENLPLCFEMYSEHGYWKFDYAFSDESLQVTCNYYDTKETFLFQKLLHVQYSQAAQGIESITEEYDGSKREIYNYNLKKSSKEELLEEAKEKIVDSIVGLIEEGGAVKEEMECLLLEYTCQGPFPPRLGLSPKEEVAKGEDPLSSFYWVNEMMYQIELDDDRVLYETLNSFYDEAYDAVGYDLDEEEQNAEYDKIAKEIFDVYVDICKKLKTKRKIKASIPTTQTFHITARDYEACNEWDFLQVLLPKARVKKLQKLIDAYKEGGSLSPEDKAIVMEIEETLEHRNSEFKQLKENLEAQETTTLYAPKLYFFLEPYGFELALDKADDRGELLTSSYLSSQPEGEDYFLYKFKEDKVLYIAQYRHGGKLWSECFYTYGNNTVLVSDFHYFSSGLELDSFSQWEIQDTKPIKSVYYAYGQKMTKSYIYKNDNIIEMKEEDIMCSFEFMSKYNFSTAYDYDYDYDTSKNLQRITRYADKTQNQNIQYCSDFSYLDEMTDKIIQISYESIISEIQKGDLEESVALVVEYYGDMLFPIYNFSLLSLDDDKKIHWEEKRTNARNIDDGIFVNFIVATASGKGLTEDSDEKAIKCHACISRVFRELQNRLYETIKEKFGIELETFIKAKEESSIKIENQLYEKNK